MTGGYGELLTDPRAFFERELDDPSLLMPILVVVLVGVLGAVAFWIQWGIISEFMANAVAQAGDPEAQNMMSTIATVGGAFGVAFAFIMAFVGWAYYGLLFFGLSALMDGEGGFKSTMIVAAWGFVPKILEVLIQIAGNYYLAQTITVPATVDRAGQQAFQQELASSPVGILYPVLGIVVLAVSAYIWYNGMQEARRLDSREALITVGIPVGIVVLLRLLNLVNAVA